MYRRVLLAYDGTREARNALREGALLAKACGAGVFLLCVVPETPGLRLGEGVHAGVIPQTHESYRADFDAAMEKLEAFGFEPQGKLVSGEPVAEITRFARAIEADLVVVGHRRRSLIERWWSGQTGANLLDHIGCSLLIARSTISDEAFAAALAAEPEGA